MEFRSVQGRTFQVPDLDLDDLEPALDDMWDEFEFDHAVLSGVSCVAASGSGSLTKSLVTSSNLSESRFDEVSARSVTIESTDLSNAQWRRLAPRVVHISRCRGTGFEVSLVGASDFVAEECKFDLAAIHIESCKGAIVFADCSFRDAAITGDISGVVFAGCDLSGVEFNVTGAFDCDLRSSSLEGVKGISRLRGAVITAQQAALAARGIAIECGLRLV